MAVTVRFLRQALTGLALVLLAGCSALSQATPTPLPTVMLDDSQGSASAPAAAAPVSGGVTASGVVAPALQARLAAGMSGLVDSVEAAVGDSVATGQVLVRLSGSESLAAAVEAANLELLAARQELLNAQAARQALDDNLPQAQTNALQALNDARQALKDAESKAAGLNGRASQADLDEAQAALILAQEKLERARKDYEEVENRSGNNLVRAALLNKYAQAQREYDNALRRYNNLSGGSTEFYEGQTLAELEIAKARLAQAEQDYDTLLGGPRPEDVAQAEARIETANGRITAAEAAILSARASLDRLEIKAPFAGVVAELSVHAGEWVVPGQPLLLLADLANLQIQTTDLSERDIPTIQTGMPVTVFVKSLQENVPGKVTAIAPLAATLGGDVVYETTIQLDAALDGLRAGMSVEVHYGP